METCTVRNTGAGSRLNHTFKELGSLGLGYLYHGGYGEEAVVRLPSSSLDHEGFDWLSI